MLTRCKSCDCRYTPVPGDGPKPCRFMAIGERPGPDENRDGIPFVGKSGQEQNENYLPLAGLSRDDVYVTNAVKCYADQNRKPSATEIMECSRHHLIHELNAIKPELVFLLGASACSLCPEIDLELHHGFPLHVNLLGRDVIAVPMYHPAAGMHDTGVMIPLLEDWERARDVVNGTWGQTKDLITVVYDYMTVPSYSYLNIHPQKNPIIAIDTENHGPDKFSFQLCPGAGRAEMATVTTEMELALKGAITGVTVLRQVIEEFKPTVLLHNAIHDLDELEYRWGITIPRHLVRDTMQEAYHLGNLPQGLKALAYRLLGVRMRTWEDVVKPHSRNAMIDWLVNAREVAERKFQVVEEKQLKTKIKRIVKQHPISKDLTRILSHTVKERESTAAEYDPWEKWGEIEDGEIKQRLIQECGKPPLLGIGNVPEKEALEYGCGDADMTFRVGRKLYELRSRADRQWGGNGVRDEDRDR